jgi:regulator of sigma E protease
MEFLQYTLALIVTLGILVTFHELGHFVIARLSGVHVTRFSIGFGRALLSWRDRRDTEFVIAAIPLGGYVRMFDEREIEPPFEGAPPATVPGGGGPIANFILAIFVYWALFVIGTTEVVPMVATTSLESPAYRAGIEGGEELVSIDATETLSWPEITMALASRLGDSGAIVIETRRPGSDATLEHTVAIDTWHKGVDEPDLLGSLGLVPTLPAVLGDVLADTPAEAAGLLRLDRIASVDGVALDTWREWVDVVRAAPETSLALEVERGGQLITLGLTPGTRGEAGENYGFAGVGPLTREIEYGPIEAVGRSLAETWSKTLLTLNLLKKMITGLVSTKNLAGPITIAKVAGDSASSGLENFFGVLARLSISLGVLNLLPIPILDGGHVVFCLAELVSGRPVSEKVQALSVQIGLFLVGGLMLLAFYNDITRLF